MQITLGPFYTCFLITIFLCVYLHVIIHRSSVFSERTLKFSMIGILIILVRMAVPFDFPFTYTIFSYQFLPRLVNFTTFTIPVGDWNVRVGDFIFSMWMISVFILLAQLLIHYVRLRRFLIPFYIGDSPEYSHLFELLRKCYEKPMRIAVMPAPISPAVTGFLKPVLLLPDPKDLSDRELEYIFLHETAHYKKHHLWLSLWMEIFCRIHWWNPFVQYLKREFSLFLELSNDFFLIHEDPEFDTLDYAGLIVKTAKKVHTAKHPLPNRMMNFAISDTPVLTTRIKFILGSKETAQSPKRPHTALCCALVSAAVLLTVFVVPEANFEELYPIMDGAVTIQEDNAYLVRIGEGYATFVDGKYWGYINNLPDGWEDIPVRKKYKKGDLGAFFYKR